VSAAAWRRLHGAARGFWLDPVTPEAAAFLRLALAALALVQLAVLWPHLLMLYGNFGFVQWAVVEASNNAWVPSIGKIALVLARCGIDSSTAVHLLFGLYGASLLVLLIGYRTRWFAVLAWLCHAVTLNSGFFSLYGVDTMMHILFFYLALSPAGAMWSLDARSGRTSAAPSSLARVAQRLLQGHLCIIYLNTGLAKASGEQWWSGEAIWRAVMQPQFNVFDFSWLTAHPTLAALLGWSVLAVELGYALFIWLPWTRRPTLFATIAMHVGIAVTMRLWLFSLVMIAFNLAAFGWRGRSAVAAGSSRADVRDGAATPTTAGVATHRLVTAAE
jgi:hypothetical protein